MKLDQAIALRDALDAAIDKAVMDGAGDLDLQGSLSTDLGEALDELKAAIEKGPQG